MPENIDRYKRDLAVIETSAEFKKDTKTKMLVALAAQNPPKVKEEQPKTAATAHEAKAPGAKTPHAKKDNTVRPKFPRWMRPAMAAAVVLTVGVISAVWVLTNQGGAVNTEQAMMYTEDAPAAAMDDAMDEGAQVAEEADLYAADADVQADGLEGYFSGESYSRAAEALRPDSYTVGEMQNLDTGYQAITLNGFDEFGGLLLGGEDIPETLPVFRNTAQYGTDSARLDDVEATLEALGYETVALLDMPLQKIRHHENTTLSYIEFGLDGASVYVYADETVGIQFDQPQKIVAGNVTANSPRADWEELATETVRQYPTLFAGMQYPCVELVYERTFTGNALWYASVYDGAGNAGDKAQSRSLRGAQLAYNETGGLVSITLARRDGAPLGSYSTISLEEATEALAAGNSVTTLPYTFPGIQYIEGVDLVYLATGYEESFLPFYLFYVQQPDAEMPEGTADGLTTYGMWYVPALSGEHVNDTDGQPFFG